MHNARILRWLAALVWIAFAAGPLHAASTAFGPLVSAEWLERNLGRDDLLVLDASPAPAYAARHIPGARHVDVMAFGAQRVSPPDMERHLQAAGVSAGRRIVVYDAGGDMMATRLFFDLHHHGVPAGDVAILDGGLAKWQARGSPVTQEVPPAAKKGDFRVAPREDVRVYLPEFLVASGDPARNAMVEALDPGYHFGETKFFDRAGHVPNAIMLPSAHFYNDDKTFRSRDEIARMVAYLGIRPDQKVLAYCGGGIAASVPFFALRFLLGYPDVKLYVESQLEWLQDERGLPLWTYDAPYLVRDKAWLAGWGSRMMRMYGVTRLSVIDVRPAEAYRAGHVPFALNVPADAFRRHLAEPAKLARILGPAGVDPAHEAVVVSDGGLNPAAALALLALERAGQKRVSILADSMDDWGFEGFALTRDVPAIGPRKGPYDVSIPPTDYAAKPREGVIVERAAETKGLYPKVVLVSGATMPAKLPGALVVHVPYASLLNPDGTPKPASEIWKILDKAGVPRYAEILCVAQDPGEAAVNYVVLKMMGYPDVKVLAI